MADFIDANEAKTLLGCDDATLNNYVNNGTIRAQRVDGQLMLHREDVINLAGASASDSDDGTIILSGDSEDLSIDLGEVVDDSAVTMVQTQSDDQSDSITFGDELEVVNFDDENNTEELSFDDSDATQSLTFTDSNTAVATDVDETVVGTATATATATSDFQTVDYDDEDEGTGSQTGGGTMRRSVRSQRVRYEKPKTHWIWPTLLILNLLIAAFLVYPYFYLLAWPQKGAVHEYTGEQKRGVLDQTVWTNLADSLAGFSAEPDEEAYLDKNPEGQWIDIADGDPAHDDTKWRYEIWQGSFDSLEAKEQSYIITDIDVSGDAASDDPTKMVPTGAKSQPTPDAPVIDYNVIEVQEEGSDATVYKPQWKP